MAIQIYKLCKHIRSCYRFGLEAGLRHKYHIFPYISDCMDVFVRCVINFTILSRAIILQGWVSDVCLMYVWQMFPFFLFFYDGITFERFELESWNFVCGLILKIFSKNELMGKFRPPQPPYPLPKQSQWDNFYNFRPISMKSCIRLVTIGLRRGILVHI